MQRTLMIIVGFCCLSILHVLADKLVSNVDLQHGNEQVVKMLSDRPEMAQFTTANGELRKVTEEDTIWQWVANNYGQKINGSVVEWDKRDLSDKPIQYLAEHEIPRNGSNGLVRIRTVFKDWKGQNTRNARFDELWAACVFELINMRSARDFMALYACAIEGDVSRKAWIRGNTKLEHKACLEIAAFYREIWVPWSKKTDIKPGPVNEYWCLDVPNDYDKWIQRYNLIPIFGSVENPYTFWGDYYDNMIKPYLEEVKKWRRLNPH